MSKSFRILLVLTFAVFIVFNLLACQPIRFFTNSTGLSNKPLKIYKNAWNIIKDEYYDSELNHVDWDYWEHRYDDVIKTNEDAHIAIESMLESLNDRYTRLLTPDQFADQDQDIESKISGVGIEIAEKDNEIMIVSVLKGTPAEKAKLQDNDKIISVNGISTKGMSLRDVAKHIRGKIGTEAHFVVLRDDKKISFNVKRDEIKIKSVIQKSLNNNISYIRLMTFISQDADVEMEEAVINSRNSDAIILDIRSNHGGLLPNAVSIANIFIEKGSKIVSIIDRNGHTNDIYAQTRPLTDIPLVVMINGSSASASEILSGALKDHKRAVLVGEKTFGKGLVQKIFDLADGSGINVTVSKYVTPKGIDINKVGILPDVNSSLIFDDLKKGVDTQLNEAKQTAINLIKKYNKEKETI